MTMSITKSPFRNMCLRYDDTLVKICYFVCKGRQEMLKGQTPPPKYETPEEVKDKARTLVKGFMRDNDITAVKLAEKLKEAYGRSASRTNILNKLARSSFSLIEFMQIVEAYGYKIEVVPDKKPIEGKNLNL